MTDILHCGGDKEMFIKAANAGLPALLWVENNGLFFRCEAAEGFVFSKKLLMTVLKGYALIEESNVGRSLTCRYKRGAFPRGLVDRLADCLDLCEGPLKELLAPEPAAARKAAEERCRRTFKVFHDEELRAKLAIKEACLADPDLLRRRIVIAEDEAVIVAIGRIMLYKLGFTNFHFVPCHLDEVLRQAKELEADLVVGRNYVAGGKGVDLCRGLRAQPDTRDVKIVLFTGSRRQDCQEALACGVQAFLEKPANYFTLGAVIAEVLGGKRNEYGL